MHVGIKNIARIVDKMYVGISGKARRVKKVYIGVNNKARLAYNGSIPLINYDTGLELIGHPSNQLNLISTALLYDDGISEDLIIKPDEWSASLLKKCTINLIECNSKMTNCTCAYGLTLVIHTNNGTITNPMNLGVTYDLNNVDGEIQSIYMNIDRVLEVDDDTKQYNATISYKLCINNTNDNDSVEFNIPNGEK